MTMKKYIKPEITIVDIDTENILAATLSSISDSLPGSEAGNENNNVFSKGHTDIWGFDEDED